MKSTCRTLLCLAVAVSVCAMLASSLVAQAPAATARIEEKVLPFFSNNLSFTQPRK